MGAATGLSAAALGRLQGEVQDRWNPNCEVEGGANVAGDFHRAGLVDRYVIYTAPALFGGDDARGLFGGNGAWDISEVRRGRFVAVERVGTDLRLEMVPDHTGAGTDGPGVEAGSAGGS